ncbi:hypothetical protein ACFSHQ_23180 [Gemmobacter lanyuensis]
MALLIDQIEIIVGSARDLGELRELLASAYPDLATSRLAARVAAGLLSAELAGREGALDG